MYLFVPLTLCANELMFTWMMAPTIQWMMNGNGCQEYTDLSLTSGEVVLVCDFGFGLILWYFIAERALANDLHGNL